jgi:hypothetical protein
MEQLFAAHQEQVAEGFARAKFNVEARGCVSFLARQSVADTALALQLLARSQQPYLAEFCRARLRAKAEKK